MPVLQQILEITGLFYACKWNGVIHSGLGATRGSPVKAGRLQVAYRGSVRLRGRRSRQHSRLRMHGAMHGAGIAVRGALLDPRHAHPRKSHPASVGLQPRLFASRSSRQTLAILRS